MNARCHNTPDCEAHGDDSTAGEETGEGNSDCADYNSEDVATTEPDEGVCAGCRAFEAVVVNQCVPLVMNGLVSSYRCKLWAIKNGRDVSLGTVGTERLWRNLQRCARNKGRSHSCLDTLNILTIMRWICQMTMRIRSGAARNNGVAEKDSHRKRDHDMGLVAEGIASSLLVGSGAMAPLYHFGAVLPFVPASLDDVGYLPRLFLEGAI